MQLGCPFWLVKMARIWNNINYDAICEADTRRYPRAYMEGKGTAVALIERVIGELAGKYRYIVIWGKSSACRLVKEA